MDKVIENPKSWSSGSAGSNSQSNTPVYDFDLPIGAVIEEVVDDTYGQVKKLFLMQKNCFQLEQMRFLV